MESIPPPLDDPSSVSKEERTMAMICHLLPLLGFLMPHFPVLNFMAPLVLWVIKKDGLPFLDQQGREVMNFQITISIIAFLGGLLLALTWWLLIPIAIAGAFVLGVVILMVLGAVRANDGITHRYPFALRLL